MSVLDTRETAIIHERFLTVGGQGTMKAIVRKFRITKERVQQIINEAISKMEAYGK